MSGALAVLALVASSLSMGILVWSRRRAWTSPLLILGWLTHGLLWSMLPGVYRVADGIGLPETPGAMAWGWMAVLQAAFLLTLVLAHLGLRRPAIPAVPAFFDRVAPGPRRVLQAAVTAFVLLIIVELAVNRTTGATFGEATAFSVTASSSELAKAGLLETVLSFLVAFGLAIISLGRPYGLTRVTILLGYGLVVAHAAFGLTRGLRSVVLLPVVAGLIGITTLHGKDRRRAVSVVALVAVITVVLGAPVATALGVVRGFASPSLSFESLREGLQTAVAGTPLGTQITFVAAEVNRKFDAVGPGVELLALEPPETAGPTPLLSAMLSPIPRVLYPDKPVPTSRDGTYLGTPYRVAAKAYGDPEVGMVVPVTASAISLWELGWAGIVLLLVANVLNLVVLNSCLLTTNVVVRALGISLLGLPTAEFLIAPTSSIVRDLLRLSVMLAGIAFCFLCIRGLARSAPKDAPAT